MTVISLAHSNIAHSQSSADRVNLSARAKAKRNLVFFLIFAIVLCGFLYVTQINNSTAKGYQIRTLKNQLSELEKVNEDYQISISAMKSINFLEGRASDIKMVQVQAKSVDYLAYPSINAVAAK